MSLHAHKNRNLWDVLETATGARRQPLVFAITTAGFDKHSVCWQQHDYGEKVLDGIIEDDSHFAFIASLDPEDDWTDSNGLDQGEPEPRDLRKGRQPPRTVRESRIPACGPERFPPPTAESVDRTVRALDRHRDLGRRQSSRWIAATLKAAPLLCRTRSVQHDRHVRIRAPLSAEEDEATVAGALPILDSVRQRAKACGERSRSL